MRFETAIVDQVAISSTVCRPPIARVRFFSFADLLVGTIKIWPR